MDIEQGISKSSTALNATKERSSQPLDRTPCNNRPCLNFKEFYVSSEKAVQEARKEFSDSYVTTDNLYNRLQTKPTVEDVWTKDDDHKTVRMPYNFPGMKIPLSETKNEGKSTPTKRVKSQNEDLKMNKITIDDLEKVLSPRRGKNSGKIKTRREERLPRIKISKARESSTQQSQARPRGGSHYFNSARMMTELNEVCQIKEDNITPQEKINILSLKTVLETRRYSVFTPRANSDDRSRQHTRSRSLPNLDIQDNLPKRYFVKLDPIRASAIPVNLGARNESSKRCRIVSENLRKLDEEGIEPSEMERKVLIGQWIRETTQVRQRESNFTTELEL